MPVTWLLDTNVVSEMMRSKPELRVVEFFDAIGVEEFGISTITVWEILNGIGRLDSSRRRAKITEQFHGLLSMFLKNRFSIGLLRMPGFVL